MGIAYCICAKLEFLRREKEICFWEIHVKTVLLEQRKYGSHSCVFTDQPNTELRGKKLQTGSYGKILVNLSFHIYEYLIFVTASFYPLPSSAFFYALSLSSGSASMNTARYCDCYDIIAYAHIYGAFENPQL